MTQKSEDDIGADSMGPAGLGPPQSWGPRAHHMVEPPPQYFAMQNLIFMYYFNKLTQLQLDLPNVIRFSVNSLNLINSVSQFLIV